jgi:hypothetical protein
VNVQVPELIADILDLRIHGLSGVSPIRERHAAFDRSIRRAEAGGDGLQAIHHTRIRSPPAGAWKWSALRGDDKFVKVTSTARVLLLTRVTVPLPLPVLPPPVGTSCATSMVTSNSFDGFTV